MPSQNFESSLQPLSHSRLPALSFTSVRARASRALRAVATEAVRRIEADLREELGCELRITGELLPRSIACGSLDVPAHCLPVVLECSTTGAPAVLELETSIVSALLERLAGGDGLPSLPGELHEADLAAAAYLVLVALSSARAEPLIEGTLALRLLDTGNRSETSRRITSENEWSAVEFSIALPRASGRGRLLLPVSSIDRLIASAPASGACELTPALLARELTASIRTGGIALDSQELHALREGDVVLVTGTQRFEDGFSSVAELRFDAFSLRGALSGFDFTHASVEDAISAEDLMKTTPLKAPPPLPIELKVELARVRIPMSNLASLEPGSVLRLGMSLSDHVTLLLGDAPFARAELVDVGGELGARVVELLGGAR